MVRRIAFTLLAATLFSVSAVRAEEEAGNGNGLSDAYSLCTEKADGVTVAMVDCTSAEIQRQETRLAKIYSEVLAEQNKAGQERMKKSERLWSQFREADVEFYFEPEGGSAAHLKSLEHYLDLTADRAAELEHLNQE